MTAHGSYLRKLATETARERVRRARQHVRDARASRRGAKANAQQACLDARRTLREWRTTEKARVKAEIARLRSELAEGIAKRKARVAQCCGPDKAQAREEGNALVAGTRAELADLLEAQRLERIWKGKGKAGKAPARSTHREARAESDHEVEVNLTPEQRIVWERVKGKIKPGTRRSRTEAFLEWMHDHSADVARIHADEADRQVREAIKHEKEQRKALEAMPKASEKRLRDYLAAGLEAIGVAGMPLVSPAAALTNVAIKHASSRPPRPLSERPAVTERQQWAAEQAALAAPFPSSFELEAPSRVQRTPSIRPATDPDFATPPPDRARDLAAGAALTRAQQEAVDTHVPNGSEPLLDDASIRRAVLHGWSNAWGPDSRGYSQRERDDALDEYRRAFGVGRRAYEAHAGTPAAHSAFDTSAAPPAPPGRINIGAPYAHRPTERLDHVGVGDLVTTQRGLQGPEGGISSGFPLIVTAIHGQTISLEDEKRRPFAAHPDWLTVTNPNLSQFAEHPAKLGTPRAPRWLKSAEEAHLTPEHDESGAEANAWAYFESVHYPSRDIARALLALPAEDFAARLNVHGAEAIAAARRYVEAQRNYIEGSADNLAKHREQMSSAHRPPDAQYVGRAHARSAKRGNQAGKMWGVFPHAEWSSARNEPEITGRGYVARRVDAGVPYSRMEPLKRFKTERSADKHASKLTREKPAPVTKPRRAPLEAPRAEPGFVAGPDYAPDDYAAFARRVLRVAENAPRKPLGDGSADEGRALLRGVFDAGGNWWLSDRNLKNWSQWELWQQWLRACVNLGLLHVARWDLLGRDEYAAIREANAVKLPGQGEAHLLVLDAAPVPF
jgi:hypothetical protein